jgi:hypothetical protein
MTGFALYADQQWVGLGGMLRKSMLQSCPVQKITFGRRYFD